MGFLYSADGSIRLGETDSKITAQIELGAYVTVGQTDQYGKEIWTSVGPFKISSEKAHELVTGTPGLWEEITRAGVQACREIATATHFDIPSITAVGKSGYWKETKKAAPYSARGPGYVYIFRVEGNDLFKVGISRRPSDSGRLESIKTASPFDVVLYREYRVANMLRVEKMAHSRLAEFNTTREWFRCSEETVVDAVEWAMNKVCSEAR